MGKAMDVYKAYFELSWSNPPSSFGEALAKYVSDDFVNLNSDGVVEGDKEAWGAMVQLMNAALSDLKYPYTSMREEGDSVIVVGHFEGTHTGDFDLSAMGLGVIPASGKHIVWPDSTTEFKIAGDKIVSAQDLSGGGMAAFFAPFGITMPPG
jgi:predicted ester cyclase